jgi:hypothetical protein
MAGIEASKAVTKPAASLGVIASQDGRQRWSDITETAGRAWDVWLGMPLMMHVGLLVVCLGTLFDMWAHWSAGNLSPTLTRFTVTERLGHWIVLVGMLISITGVVMRGYRRPAQASDGHKSRR